MLNFGGDAIHVLAEIDFGRVGQHARLLCWRHRRVDGVPFAFDDVLRSLQRLGRSFENVRADDLSPFLSQGKKYGDVHVDNAIEFARDDQDFLITETAALHHMSNAID